jgi:transposase
MLCLLSGGRILVAVEPVDGCNGFDFLAGFVRSVLKGDSLSGDLYVIKTRRADKLKILSCIGGGFALYLRRLEKGNAKRHALNPWVDLTDVLTRMSAKPSDLKPLLPDAWAKQQL